MTGRREMRGTKPILNCGVRFEFKCPRDWGDLAQTGDDNIRYCNECGRNVFFCAGDEEMIAHARRGDCVAGAWLADGDFEPVEWVGGLGLDTDEDFRQMDIEIQMEALKAPRQKRAKKR